MPRDGAIIFGDLIGKLDVLRAACDKRGRVGRYRLCRLIDSVAATVACPTGSTRLLAIARTECQ